MAVRLTDRPERAAKCWSCSLFFPTRESLLFCFVIFFLFFGFIRIQLFGFFYGRPVVLGRAVPVQFT